jgi:hypothetical protein
VTAGYEELAPAPVDRVWRPEPPQLKVYSIIGQAPKKSRTIIGYGGAAGGGKTRTLAELAIDLSLAKPGARTLLARNDLVHLKSTTLEVFDMCLPAELRVDKRDTGPIWRDIRSPDWPAHFPNSRVYFAGLKNAKDGIGSEEFGWILIDEGHEVADNDARYLFSRLRHTPEEKWGMVVGFNPWPSWCVDWFYDHTLPEDLLQEGDSVHFVRARIMDNPHVDPGYLQFLRATLSDYEIAVLVEGRAEAVPNAIFAELAERRPQIVTALPSEMTFTRAGIGVDWGTTKQHQSAVVCASRAKSGVVWIRGSWMSPVGSSNELAKVAGRFRSEYGASFARYDASQGSLKDDLLAYFPSDVDKGTRDVDGRIRALRGLLARDELRIDMAGPGNAELVQQLLRYHRKDDGTVNETYDDLVDACLYVVAELERPGWGMPLSLGGAKQGWGQPIRKVPRSAFLKKLRAPEAEQKKREGTRA